MEERTTTEASSAMRLCRIASIRNEMRMETDTPAGLLTGMAREVFNRTEDQSLRNRLCSRLLMLRDVAGRRA